MATVTDGMYRISLYGQSFLAGAGDRVMLLPPDETTGQWWEIRRTEGGDYTIRHVGGQYASTANDPPQPFEPVRLSTQQRTWTIADGPEENTVTLGAPGTDLTLGLSPLLIYPPYVALSPPYQQDRGWTLHPV